MYSVESLEKGIEKAKENIKIFEDAIDKERNMIKEYRSMIDTIERKKREASKRKLIEEQIRLEGERNGDKC